MDIYQPTEITEETVVKFRPTRLAIKELAGQLYFCKSIVNNIETYPGSGVRWRNRIKKYGKKNIKTLWVSDWYHCPHEIQEVALHFSKENQIVESERWANIKPENGLDGGWARDVNVGKEPWNKGHTKSDNETVAIYADKLKGRTKENDPSKAKAAASLSASKKGKICPGVEAAAKKRKGQTKDSDTGVKSMAEKKRGRTKENHEGVARQSLRMIGKEPSNIDRKIYQFVHDDGRVEIIMRKDFIRKYVLNQSRVMMLIRGEAKNHKGWSLVNPQTSE